MNKYHISADGEAKRCTAEDGKCPLKNSDGNPAAHGNFASDAEARSFAEEINKAKFGGSFAQAEKDPSPEEELGTENFTTVNNKVVPIYDAGSISVAVDPTLFAPDQGDIADYADVIWELRNTPWPSNNYEDPALTEKRFRKWLRGSPISKKDYIEIEGTLSDLKYSPSRRVRNAAARVEGSLLAYKVSMGSKIADEADTDTRSPSEVLRDLGDLTEAPEDVMLARKEEISRAPFSDWTGGETIEVAAINSEFERRMWARRDAAKQEAEFSLPEDPSASA